MGGIVRGDTHGMRIHRRDGTICRTNAGLQATSGACAPTEFQAAPDRPLLVSRTPADARIGDLELG